jgi:hypothetical protein
MWHINTNVLLYEDTPASDMLVDYKKWGTFFKIIMVVKETMILWYYNNKMLVHCYGEMLIVFMNLVNFFYFYHFILIALDNLYTFAKKQWKFHFNIISYTQIIIHL